MKVLENGLDIGLSTKANTGNQEYQSHYHIVFGTVLLPQKQRLTVKVQYLWH